MDTCESDKISQANFWIQKWCILKKKKEEEKSNIEVKMLCSGDVC